MTRTNLGDEPPDPYPPICRHRAGDPECMCHPEPDELSDPEADRLADVETRNKWAREAIAALPAVPRMWNDAIRSEVEETRRLVEDIINEMRSDLA